MSELTRPSGVSSDYINLKGLWDSCLKIRGYTLVSGSFGEGATVTSKLDAVFHQGLGKCYYYNGASTFPQTIDVGTSVIPAGWVEVGFTADLLVGNDPSGGPYHFNQLSDALELLSSLAGHNHMNNQSTFRIVVPAGRHKFNALRIRGCDLSNTQIWGLGGAAGSTTIECVPDNITDGIWLSMRFAHLGDIAGIRLVWASEVTSPTDPEISCQRWYGSGSAPWLPNQTASFVDMLSSTIGRMSDIGALGDETFAGCRLGSFINAACSTIHQIDGFDVRNLRDMIVAYNGSVIGSGYNTIRGTQVYNFLVNHESYVTIRNAAASAFNTVGAFRPGSVFIDTFRGYSSVLAGVAGVGVTRFDTLFLQDAGDIVCGINANLFSFYNKFQESYGDASRLATKLTTTDSDTLLSNNHIQLLTDSGLSDVNPTSRKYGSLEYTGNGAANNIISVPTMVRKLTIRNRTTNMSISLHCNQVLLNASGTNAAWFNNAAASLVVYTGDFNTSAVKYDVLWER